jgi:hypothetical protein
MNLRRGLFRLWIVATLLWVAAFAWYVSDCSYLADRLTCRVADTIVIRDYVSLSAIALGVPLGLLFVGYPLTLIIRVFLPPQSK